MYNSQNAQMALLPFVHSLYYPEDTVAGKYSWDHFVCARVDL